MSQAISVLLCALGGEGGGVLADWLVDAAHHAGYPVQATSVPGVAQRTGATTYYLEVFPAHISTLKGQRPVFGLNPLPGRLDLLVSSELLETARQIGNGMVSADRTFVISANNRTLTTFEKMPMGDGRMDDAALLALLEQHSRTRHVLDMASLTREAGTVVSAVMLGCIAASGVLPMRKEDFRAAIRNGLSDAQLSASQRASLRGFELAWNAIKNQQAQLRYVDAVIAPALQATSHTSSASASNAGDQAPTLPAHIAALFPATTHEVLALGVARLVDYQNQAYADLYVQRLQNVLSAETTHANHRNTASASENAPSVTQEVARWLALWMAFDDIVRVADLKSRASRWQRVRTEVKAKDDDVLKLYDHFKPGVPEIAALLPQGLANTLLRWDKARSARGQAPLAFPLKVGTHSVFGMVMLRMLASLKWLRPMGHRYQEEQQLITQWLDAVTQATHEDATLGLALARCGRLIKGYGSTHDRGRDNLLHILRHLAPHAPGATHFENAAARAQAIDQACAAALRDEAGNALDVALRQHGVPTREVRAQPIRWMKRNAPNT
jgi:indolepyruvate ferredoxin oxidoreductase beta subunit